MFRKNGFGGRFFSTTSETYSHMKSNVQTLSSASHRENQVANWLSSKNYILSTLLGCRITNLSLISVVFFTLLAFATLLLASDANKEYGWAAFFGMAALQCALVIIREFKKGGQSWH